MSKKDKEIINTVVEEVKLTEEEQMIKLWNDLGLSYVDFLFNCGGDSMGDTVFEFYDNKGFVNPIDKEVLEDYFDTEIYKNVDFYENSDGHYIGESGIVKIELNEGKFTYSKEATSEFSEEISTRINVKLTDEQIAFLTEYVTEMRENEWEGEQVIYKKDFILNDEKASLLKGIQEMFYDEAQDAEFETSGEIQDESYTYRSEIEIVNTNEIVLEVSCRAIVYGESI